jgi:hypothetical protein
MFARSFAKTLRSFSTRAVGKTESKTSIYTIGGAATILGGLLYATRGLWTEVCNLVFTPTESTSYMRLWTCNNGHC